MSAHATLNDFLLALPELVLLAGACALMIADLFVKDPRREASFIIAMLVLLACAGFDRVRDVGHRRPRSPTPSAGCTWRT